MKKTWIEVFRTGTHKSQNGVEQTYTEAHLDMICKKYNEQSDHKAPLVIGHPQVDDPAYGWIEELKRVKDRLMAYVEPVSEKIITAVESGMFKRVSIALYADNLLRHVGLLGAAPPAVKGLAPVEFAADKEFEEYLQATSDNDDRLTFKGLKQFFSEFFKDSKPFTQKNIQEDDMTKEEITALFAEQVETLTKAFSEKINVVLADNKALKDKIDVQYAEFNKKLRDQQFNDAVTSFTTFCDGLIKEGKVLAGERDELIEQYKDLQKAEGVMQFAEGEKTPTAKMCERLSARPANAPSRVQFARREQKETGASKVVAQFADSGKEVNELSVQIDTDIRKYAEENKVSYEEAAIAYASGRV